MMPVLSSEREIAPDRAAAPATADVARIPGKYLSITSFRRDGSGVATRCGSPRRVTDCSS
jgi:hypothetical protein